MSKLSKRVRVMIRDRFTCRYCGRSALRGEVSLMELTADHWVPSKPTKRNDIDNIVCACSLCNRIKGHCAFLSFDDAIAFINNQCREQELALIERLTSAAENFDNKQTLLEDLLVLRKQCSQDDDRDHPTA